jgi:hypothetical protein
MKRFALICFLICTLGLADIPAKPVVHVTISPAQTTYYASSFDDPAKFDFKYVEWNAFVKKHKYGYTLVEGQWMREQLQNQQTSTPVRFFIPPSERRGGLIITPTISGAPSKK